MLTSALAAAGAPLAHSLRLSEGAVTRVRSVPGLAGSYAADAAGDPWHGRRYAPSQLGRERRGVHLNARC